MNQYQSLLLIADGSQRRTPAFERAAWLARTSGARLHIAAFDYSALIAAAAQVDGAGAQRAQDAWLDQLRRWLSEQTQLLKEQDIDATSEAIWAHPVRDSMLDTIAGLDPDIVIKDVHRESALKRLLLTPLDWHLLRDCPQPLLLVNPLAHAVPRRVLAAVDASAPYSAGDFNDAIVHAALGLAIQCDAELHLAHCFDIGHAAGYAVADMTMDFGAELYQALYGTQKNNFEALSRAHSVPADRAHFLSGKPAIEPPSLAQQLAVDVIVLGTHQRRGLDRLIMGSAAEAIIDNSFCDVLAIKPEGHRSVA